MHTAISIVHVLCLCMQFVMKSPSPMGPKNRVATSPTRNVVIVLKKQLKKRVRNKPNENATCTFLSFSPLKTL